MFGPERAQAELLDASDSAGDEDVSFYRIRYTGRSKPSGISDQLLLFVNSGASVAVECRIGRAVLDHEAPAGNITIIPAETEWSASIPRSAEGIVLALPKTRMAVAAARTIGSADRIEPRLRGTDPLLLSIVREISLNNRSPGTEPGLWHSTIDELADHLSITYAGPPRHHVRGRLSPDVVKRINDYLENRLDAPLVVDDVADVAKQSRSHFPRVFRRTIGMSPHQYLMRLRLRRARSLIEQHWPLAEAAAVAGFSDQSHLTHWVRRIYGTTPARLFVRL